MLSSLGYEPVLARSGEEALEIFRMDPGRYGAVITDQVMSGMLGTDLARELLAIRPELPVILYTGFSESVTPEQARALGVREFMLKPIVVRQLAETLRRVMTPARGADGEGLLPPAAASRI
jgi:DNA-binding NtrC family response regulator